MLAVDVDEGHLEDDFTGRTWEVSCVDPNTAREQAALKNDEAKELKKQKQIKNDASKLLAAMEKLDPRGVGVTQNKLREQAGLSGERAKRAIQSLLDEEETVIEQFKGPVEIGSGTTRVMELYRHLKHAVREEREAS